MSLTPVIAAQQAIDEFLTDATHAKAVAKEEASDASTAFTAAELRIISFHRKLTNKLQEARFSEQQTMLKDQLASLSAVTATLKRVAPTAPPDPHAKRPTVDLPSPATEWTFKGKI